MQPLDERANIKLKYVSGNNTTPDVADAAPIQLFAPEVKTTLGKEINYIPRPKAGPDDWKEGSEIMALDFLKTKDKWTITGQVYQGKDGKSSLPSNFKDSNGDGVVSGQNVSFNDFGDRSAVVSFDDANDVIVVHDDVTDSLSSGDSFEVKNNASNNGDYTVSSISYDSANNETDITVNETVAAESASGFIEWSNSHEWHLLGATKIKKGSVTLEDSNQNTLAEGKDYRIDYGAGKIEVFNSGNIDTDTDPNGSPNETLSISYTYHGRNDNLARVVKRMAQRGGNIIFEFDPSTFTQEDRNVVAVDLTSDFFTVSGKHDGDYEPGDKVVVSDSTGNDGVYTVSSASFDSSNNETDVYVDSDISDSTADGKLTKKQGTKYMVESNSVDITFNTSNPDQAEVSIELRRGLDRAV